MNIAGIKLSEKNFNASCAKIVRKYRDISISDIKKLVLNNDHLFTCSSIDPDGISTILKIYYDFCNENIQSLIYENNRITSIELLNNWLESHEETSRQVEEDINNEALAEEADE